MKTGPTLAQQLLKYGEQNLAKDDADDEAEEEDDNFDMGYISGKKINSEEDDEVKITNYIFHYCRKFRFGLSVKWGEKELTLGKK